MHSKEDTIIIFVKNIEPGKVKTRLAKDIGDQRALGVYTKLMGIAAKATKSLDVRRVVAYSSHIEEGGIWQQPHFEATVQEGGDLGARMGNSIEKALGQGAHKVVLIGSDCPFYNPALLEEAFDQLDRADVVIGPALDGGYYLIGMKKKHPKIFENKQWSTEMVLQETIADLRSLGISYLELPTYRDVDTIEDLRYYPFLLEEGLPD